MTTRRVQVRLQPLIPFVTANTKQRREMLKQRKIISCLCEVVQNVLKGHVKLTRGQKQRWGRHKHKLRRLVSRRNTYPQKTKIIQKGGFLPMLIPLAVKLLGGLAGL